MSKLLELAERVERAEGPDRELDWRVADALDHPAFAKQSTLWPPFIQGSKMDQSIPAYTASIDAAMTLVPVANQADAWGSAGDAYFTGKIVTPALALTAAALRARAAVENANG